MTSTADLMRIRAACEAAIRRLDSDPAKFAPLGETLFWLCAVAEASGRDKLHVVQGLKWARNRIAHGAVVTVPLEIEPGSELGFLQLGRSALGSVTYHIWLPRSGIALVGPAIPNAKQDAAYDTEVAGRSLLEPITRALASI